MSEEIMTAERLIAEIGLDADRIADRGTHQFEQNLLIYIDRAVNAYEEYKRRGIEDKVYFNTMYDLNLWAGNCLRDYGVYGLKETGWLELHVNLKVFRLGRLQFEPITDKETGEQQLNVHIPQGEPLDIDACHRSYEQAAVFFKKNPVFVCHSWLLQPALKTLLPPDSNIVKFQSEYEIIELDNDDTQTIERVFGTCYANNRPKSIDEYPEDTALQRVAKAYLKSGGTFSGALGKRV